MERVTAQCHLRAVSLFISATSENFYVSATTARVTLINVLWSWSARTQHHVNPCELYWTELNWNLVFWTPLPLQNSKGNHVNGGIKHTGWGKISNFQLKSTASAFSALADVCSKYFASIIRSPVDVVGFRQLPTLLGHNPQLSSSTPCGCYCNVLLLQKLQRFAVRYWASFSSLTRTVSQHKRHTNPSTFLNARLLICGIQTALISCWLQTLLSYCSSRPWRNAASDWCLALQRRSATKRY